MNKYSANILFLIVIYYSDTSLAAIGNHAVTQRKTTTVYIPPPSVPPPRFTHKTDWTLPGTWIASPFERPKGSATYVKALEYTGDCSTIALIPGEGLDRLMLGTLLNRMSTYNATISWFKVGVGCAYPIMTIQYGNCSLRQVFGDCKVRSAMWWDFKFSSFMFQTDDELGLVIAAPMSWHSGQYTRVLEVNGDRIYSDFEVNINSSCWFGKPDPTTSNRCFTQKEIDVANRKKTMGLTSYFEQPMHKAIVEYWMRQRGAVVPKTYTDDNVITRTSSNTHNEAASDDHGHAHNAEVNGGSITIIRENDTESYVGTSSPQDEPSYWRPKLPNNWLSHIITTQPAHDSGLEDEDLPNATSKTAIYISIAVVSICIVLGICGWVIYICLTTKDDKRRHKTKNTRPVRSAYKILDEEDRLDWAAPMWT
ncbi:US6 [anatid alphaherpesvirus 1]|uniref:Glycoprotein D n=1 Tax=anatid alphaherpesvirus 1 TaxID=104388 RepID=B4XS31_9ALPH|nr:US6 [Anatid alphaherpesvirus 1]YP_010795384.1 US6 [Anatid alphaherpesvirus 1]AHD45994.1 US6 [BAC cloning vector pDEV-vac]QWQ49793.1 US6 [BAC cloning vector pDEV-CHa]ABU49268.2 US6 [Anatid alphaherpesvirus 1]ABY73907.1 envelope glycoprotein D [Anatid alphaherpesvirus 1]ACD43464.1 gD protein [Anatid alphaherpesvirus 1]